MLILKFVKNIMYNTRMIFKMSFISRLFIFVLSFICVSCIFVLPEKSFSQDVVNEPAEDVVIFNKTFGSMLPLSGPYSVLGERAAKGISSAIQLSEKGILYQMFLRDVGEYNTNVLNIYSSLVSESNVSFVLGPLTTDSAKKISTLIDRYKVPTVTFPVFGDSVKSSSNIIKFYYPIEDQVEYLVNYTIDSLKVKKFAVLYPKTKFGTRFKDKFIDYAKTKGGKFLHVSSYSQDLTGIEVELDWIKPFKPEAIVIADNPSRAASIISLLTKDKNFTNVLFIGPNTWNTKYFADLLENEVDGLIHKAIFTDYLNTESNEWKVFSDFYLSTFNDKPGLFEYQIYKVTKLLFSLDNNNDVKTGLFDKISNLDSSGDFRVKKTATGLEIYPKPLLLSLEGNRFIVLK